jgi:hypothetical protein
MFFNAEFEEKLSAKADYSLAVEDLEKIQAPLAYSWGVVGHLMGVKNSDDLRKAHDEAQPSVIEVFQTFGQSQPLFKALSSLKSDQAGLLSSLSSSSSSSLSSPYHHHYHHYHYHHYHHHYHHYYNHSVGFFRRKSAENCHFQYSSGEYYHTNKNGTTLREQIVAKYGLLYYEQYIDFCFNKEFKSDKDLRIYLQFYTILIIVYDTVTI